MNFGQIIVNDCENVLPLPDIRCSDPAFSIANPTICPNGTGGLGGTLILKPGNALVCALGSIQFAAVLVKNGQEIPITSNIVFSTTDPTVAVIGATSGNATGTGAGETLIQALYEDTTTGNVLTATASLTVLAGTNCCSEISVAVMVLVDVSLSMSQAFGGGYSTRLAFAKAAAQQYISQIDAPNVSVGLMTFYDGNDTLLAAPTTNTQSVAGLVSGITQTQNLTGFNKVLLDAITQLQQTGAMEQIIVLVSDGEDTSTTDTTDANDAIATASNFQAGGGIIMGLGCRAGDGFLLMEALCTGGFFINTYPSVLNQALNMFYGLKGYACLGNCAPAGNTTQPTPQLDYCGFINWWISQGTVDLLGPGLYNLLPGNGLYVDLVGGSEIDTFGSAISGPGLFNGGRMTSRNSFNLLAGHQYRFAVTLAGNQLQPESGTVQLQVFSYNSDGIANPSIAPTVMVNESGPPLAQTPTYSYVYTWTNSNGETMISPVTSVTPTNAGATMTVTAANNPVGGQIKIYRTSGATPTSPFYLVATINNGGQYVDSMNEQDFIAALAAGTVQACANPPPLNTTGTKVFYVNQQVSVGNYEQGFAQQAFTFTAPTNITAYLSIQQVSQTKVPGLLMSDVNFSDVTQLITLLDDNFQTENEQYIPPACGIGTSGGATYTGYNCYGYGCLNSGPPGPQLPDPNALPNIESGTTPPITYTSTQTQCATCPNGQVSIANLQFNAGGEESSPYQFSGIGSLTPVQYSVSLNTGTASNPELTFTLSGSNDGHTWTVLDTETALLQSGSGDGSGAISFGAYTVENPQEFSSFQLEVDGMPIGTSIGTVSFTTSAPAQACSTATATSQVSQQAADQAAQALALTQAQAQLNCLAQYTATESFTATCPTGLAGNPVTKSATVTSLISQNDAQTKATAEAQTLAEAALVCQCANTNTSPITINQSSQDQTAVPCSPYPSVQCVSGQTGNITKVTATLVFNGPPFSGHDVTDPTALEIVLVSPTGQAVLLYSQCGEANLAMDGVTLTFDDAAGSHLPCGSGISSGTFKPTSCNFYPGGYITIPLPAPQTAPSSTLAAFIGENPNGAWLLYLADVSVLNGGSLTSWSLNITSA